MGEFDAIVAILKHSNKSHFFNNKTGVFKIRANE